MWLHFTVTIPERGCSILLLTSGEQLVLWPRCLLLKLSVLHNPSQRGWSLQQPVNDIATNNVHQAETWRKSNWTLDQSQNQVCISLSVNLFLSNLSSISLMQDNKQILLHCVVELFDYLHPYLISTTSFPQQLSLCSFIQRWALFKISHISCLVIVQTFLLVS